MEKYINIHRRGRYSAVITLILTLTTLGTTKTPRGHRLVYKRHTKL